MESEMSLAGKILLPVTAVALSLMSSGALYLVWPRQRKQPARKDDPLERVYRGLVDMTISENPKDVRYHQ